MGEENRISIPKLQPKYPIIPIGANTASREPVLNFLTEAAIKYHNNMPVKKTSTKAKKTGIPDDIFDQWKEFIHIQENENNKGVDKKKGTYTQYTDPAGHVVVGDGLKVAFLPKELQYKAEKGTLTKSEHDSLLRAAIERSYRNAENALNKAARKDIFRDQPIGRQISLADIDYTTKNGIAGYPKLLEAVSKRDTTEIMDNYKRTYTDANTGEVLPLTKRNNATAILLRDSFKDDNERAREIIRGSIGSGPVSDVILKAFSNGGSLNYNSSPGYNNRPNNAIIKYANGGEITEAEKASIRAYMPTLESQAYLNREKARIRSEYGETSELARDPVNNHITAVRNIPTEDITDDVLLGATAVGALGKIAAKVIAPKVARSLRTASSGIGNRVSALDRNIQDIRYARQWNRRYGYPNIPYSKAVSTKATDEAIKDLATSHNTFYRGISMNLSKESKEELLKRGINPANERQVAEYMTTHVPPANTGVRAGMSHLTDDVGALYTSNNKGLAAMYGENGYVATVRRPLDFSAQSRKDWLVKNQRPKNVAEFNYGDSKNITNYVTQDKVGNKALDVVNLKPYTEINPMSVAVSDAAKPTLERLLPPPKAFLDDPVGNVTKISSYTLSAGSTAYTGKALVDRFLQKGK